MTGKRIIFFILTAYIIGNLLLIFIQYNSSKNINALISGNEKLLIEFNVSKRVKELERDVLIVGNNIRGLVLTNDLTFIDSLDLQVKKVEAGINYLQRISDDSYSEEYIDVLDTLVHEKLKNSFQILDSFRVGGKSLAENIMASQNGKRITDSLLSVTHKFESNRERLLAIVTKSIDKSSQNALLFGTLLIAFVLVSGAILFWYIVNTIRNQNQLIAQLHISDIKAKEAARVKENFLANMSHEIRTPMNAVLGFANLLQLKNLDNEAKNYVETIQSSGEILLAIINDILDLSKIEAGMMRIEKTPFNLRQVIESVKGLFASKASEKGLKLHCSIDDSLPTLLEGDGFRLTQILVNLVGNSIKFTDKGTVSIIVSKEGEEENKMLTGIAVMDTGIGIEKEKQENIFSRFQQAEENVTRKYGGTGLGLSIVKELVNLQDGTIRIESEPGVGSIIKVVIPFTIPPVDMLNSIPLINLELNSENKINTSILVVEDNKINQELMRQLFTIWKVPFNIVGNGKEAIEILGEKKFGIILMDIQMPEMDGYTAAIEIRNNLKLQTPIIAMTAHALTGEKQKCIEAGMNDYLPKPIREAELKRLIIQYSPPGFDVPLLHSLNSKMNSENMYQYINLQYMKEVSNGNVDYERSVTEQFLEALPQGLQALENAWKNKDVSHFRNMSHDLKTTISVMGLNDKLQPMLDAFEYGELTDQSFITTYLELKTISESAIKEANEFYESIK